MRRNDSIRSLHRKLHQKSAQRQHRNRMRPRPQRNHRNRQQRRQNDHPPASQLLRQRPADNPSRHRPKIADHNNQSHPARRHPMVLLQQRRIQILRPMTERVESRHQQHKKEKRRKVSQKRLERNPMPMRGALIAPLHLSLSPDRRLLHLELHIKRKQRRQSADHKHHPPARQHPRSMQMRKDRSIQRGRQQIANDITLLQHTREQPSPCSRQRFQRQRRPHTPLAPHSNPKQRATNQKTLQRRRERRSQFKH